MIRYNIGDSMDGKILIWLNCCVKSWMKKLGRWFRTLSNSYVRTVQVMIYTYAIDANKINKTRMATFGYF
jgi:hypothetical protein